jgi:hypothetical protein
MYRTIDAGYWPMITAREETAQTIAEVATS